MFQRYLVPRPISAYNLSDPLYNGFHKFDCGINRTPSIRRVIFFVLLSVEAQLVETTLELWQYIDAVVPFSLTVFPFHTSNKHFPEIVCRAGILRLIYHSNVAVHSFNLYAEVHIITHFSSPPAPSPRPRGRERRFCRCLFCGTSPTSI